MKDLPMMLESMNNLIEDGGLKYELEQVPVNYNVQMSLAKEMTEEKIVRGIRSQRYLDCLKETLSGLGYITGEDLSKAKESYERAYNDYYSPYMEEKEYILENYLVNEYFKEMMPFGNYKTIWDSYIFLCSLYSMVKLHLIGIAGYHHGLNDDLTLKLIQSFSKVVLHNSQYIYHIVNLLKNNEFDSLAYMSILVKIKRRLSKALWAYAYLAKGSVPELLQPSCLQDHNYPSANKEVSEEDIVQKIQELDGKGSKIMTILEKREQKGIGKGEIHLLPCQLCQQIDIQAA